jgi:GxxExxY protein
LESVYETILAYELKNKGLTVAQQVTIPFKYKSIVLPKAFVADLIVNDLIILEIKSQKSFHESHRMQLISYLKISEKKLGLLLNFGMERMMEGVSRVANGL